MWAEGLDHPEGVAPAVDGTVYAGGEAGQIYRISEDGKPVQVATTGGFLLGICLDAAGNIYACDAGKHAVFRAAEHGDVTVYSSGSSDRPMVNPNFPVFDTSGTLYVSDSGHWKEHDGCIYRIHPGGHTDVWATSTARFPNGMALSPDGKSLYVVLSLMPGVVRVPINPDGSAGDAVPVVALPDTVPDGLAFDADGNLFISCYTPDVVYRLTPGGELCVYAQDPQHVMLSSPTNLAFCGPDRRTLVFASLGRWHLARTRVAVPGHPLRYPKL